MEKIGELYDKQKIILELLEKEELATTKIAFLITSNLYKTEEYLHELENLNLIESRKQNNATYWKLKNAEKNKN